MTVRIMTSERPVPGPSPLQSLLDLSIYLGVVFLIREVYFSGIGFIANGLFWSLTALIVASVLMRRRGMKFSDLGLRRPDSFKKALIATVVILGLTLLLVIAFEIIKDQFAIRLAPDRSEQNASEKFGALAGNWGLFLSIIPLIWLQSALEEILDRGFLINWIERTLSSTWFATAFAVLLQAMIFGFRHSYDLSERSITVALIGLALGIGYVAFGRNLWPPIIAHCLLNTVSMLERV